MTDETPIRVILVDDHEMLRGGLALFLEGIDDLQLVGEASSGVEAIALCDEVKPDVVLMDLIMPTMDGVAATRAIRQKHPETQVVVLTSFKESDLVQAALEAGAVGYLLKDATVDELADAIRAAKQGKPSLSPDVFQALIHRSSTSKPAFELSDRELEVLALMVKGLTNRQIADKLSISAATVKTYVSHILTKLGVASRTEAVALALERHLIKP
jgi:two-component system, NarL family, response regulator LiaR